MPIPLSPQSGDVIGAVSQSCRKKAGSLSTQHTYALRILALDTHTTRSKVVGVHFCGQSAFPLSLIPFFSRPADLRALLLVLMLSGCASNDVSDRADCIQVGGVMAEVWSEKWHRLDNTVGCFEPPVPIRIVPARDTADLGGQRG